VGYKKGEFLCYVFPNKETDTIEASKVIAGYHRVVVLHQRETPHYTILVAPITKAGSLNRKGKIPSNYVKIHQQDYPIALDEDSFINLDMAMPIDEDELKKLERFNKRITVTLNDIDLYDLDYKIALTYELGRYFENEVDKELEKEFANVIEYIDQDIRNKIIEILSKIDNVDAVNGVIAIIDTLIVNLKDNFIKSSKDRNK